MPGECQLLIWFIVLTISLFHTSPCSCINLCNSSRASRFTFSAETCISSATRPIVTTPAVRCPCFLRYMIVADEPTVWDVLFVSDQYYGEWRTILYNGDPKNVVESLSSRNIKTQNSSTILTTPEIKVVLKGTFRLVIRTNTNETRCFSNWKNILIPTSIVLESIPTPYPVFPMDPTQRFVGGNVIENIRNLTSYRWVAEIFWDGQVICSGIVISLYGFVLTAAHCIAHVRTEEILVGVRGADVLYRRFYKVRKGFVHPNLEVLNNNEYLNNICVLELENFEVDYDEIGVLPLNYDHQTPQEGDVVTVVEYGYIFENWGGGSFGHRLRQLDSPVISSRRCSKIELFSSYNPYIHLCVGYTKRRCSVCQGNEGSPLRYIRNNGNGSQQEKLVGIMSYNHTCEHTGLFAAYTKVSRFATWIDTVVEQTLEARRNAFWTKQQILIPILTVLCFLIIAILIAAFLLWRRRKRNIGRQQDLDNRTESDMPSETGISG